jgi:hypothetical protein
MGELQVESSLIVLSVTFNWRSPDSFARARLATNFSYASISIDIVYVAIPIYYMHACQYFSLTCKIPTKSGRQ